MKKRVLYIGWVGFGNHGDDICRDIFFSRLDALGKARGIEIDFVPLFPSRFDEFMLARIQPDLVVLGAGSLFEHVYLKPLILAQQNGIPTAIWGSGYDSTSEDALVPHDLAYAIRQVVTNAHVVGIRGPYTLMALENIGALHPNLTISGDPGLLWEAPDSEALETEEKTLPQLAVNWGTANNNVLGRNEKATAKAVAQSLKKFTDRFSVLIYPMWHKDVEHCHALKKELGQSNNVKVVEELPTPMELMGIYKQSVCSINMKLHANIFSAALGCPFISVAYRWKCLDFAESVSCKSWAIPFDDSELSTRLVTVLEDITSNLPRSKEHLELQVRILKERLSKLEEEMINILAG